MKKSQLLFAVIAGAAWLAATPVGAMPIDNRINPDGTPVLIPAVRQYEARQGVVQLPQEFTVAAPDAAENEVEVLTSLVKRYFPGVPVNKAGGEAFCRLELAEQGVPDSPEGYTLEIGDRGVTIRSRDVRGLYYGVRTLGNLFRNATKPELPQCEITDWPSLAIRGMFLNLRHQGFAGCLPELLNEIDAAGALKYNYMMLEFGEKFPYKNNPFTNRKNSYSLADVEAIKAAAERNHIEIIPTLQIVTHDAWLHSHPLYKKEIAENPKKTDWSTAACHMSMLGREVQLMAIKEQIEFFKPRFFNLSMDEMDNQPWGVCHRCNGYEINELWRDATLLYTGEVLKLGVIPILYHDMYYPGKSGGGVELLPKLDKRIVFCNWDYGAELRKSRFPFFKRAGFRLFSMSYCQRMDNMRVLPKEVVKQGCDGIFLSFWGEFRYPSKPELVSGRGLAGFTLAGCYEWNPDTPPHTALTFDPAWETLRLILPERCPEAPAATNFAPLPLDSAFNLKLGRDPRFPKSDAKLAAKMQREAAMAAENFHFAVSPDGGYYAVTVNGSPNAPKTATIPVNAKAEWLALAATAGSTAVTLGGRPHAAILTVRYADGGTEEIPLAYRKNLPFWNYDGGAYGVRRFMKFNDARGALVNFYSENWRNPHPDKTISEIVLSATETDAIPVALLAVSLGNGTSEAVPNDTAAAQRLAAWSEPAAYRTISADTPGSVVLSDYSGGKLRNSRVSLSANSDDKKMGSSVLKESSAKPQSCFDGKLSYKIVKDPTSPGGGDVLVLSIPALKPEYSHLRCRLVVDMSFDRKKAGDIKTFFFDFKVSHPWYNEWPAVYLMNTQPFGAAAYMGYLEERRDRNWHHLAVPYRLFKQDKKPLDLATADTIRLSFFLRELTEPSEIRIGDVGVSSVDTGLLTPLRAEPIPDGPEERLSEVFFID
jgi:hypothetical protein